MIGKLCLGKSGSAGNLVEYLIGYAISEKGSQRAEIRDALESVYVEAERRGDLGAGQVWKPEAGHGTRPSSVLVRGCGSLSSASLEMDSDALLNPGVRSGAMHFVWSFPRSETAYLTDQQVYAYVGEVLAKIGLDEHRAILVVHRDTSNVHVHAAIGAVHPVTGIAYDRTQIYKRMAWAEREVELAHGLENDHGLAVVRDAGTSNARIEWADKHELAAWRAERREDRLLRQERRSWEGYRQRDVMFERYCDATVAPRLRAVINMAAKRRREPTYADLHAVVARYGCALQYDAEKRTVVLRDVGIAAMRYEHGREIIELRRELKAQQVAPDEIDRQLSERKAEQAKLQLEERKRKESEGDVVTLNSILNLPEHLKQYHSIDQSESQIIERVAANANIVLADVTAQSSTFSREDVDAWLCARISDPEQIERLGDLVVQDASVRVLAVDSMQPVMTTTAVLEVENRLAEDARVLARRQSGITLEQVNTAIESYERAQSEMSGTRFLLSSEQKTALSGLFKGSLLSIEGLPGVGKTVAMGVVRVLGQQTNRQVVGITLSQAAAERLESEAGFRCVNSSRAQLLEENGAAVIPEGGIVVVDEAAMMDSRANGRILAVARERGCIVSEIYDTRQLQPIDFGASTRIIRDEAKAAGMHFELRDIQRQRNAWHREAVVIMADAIVEKDESKRLASVKKSLEILAANNAIVWTKDRDRALDEAVRLHRVSKGFGNADALLIAADKDSVRHLCEQDRRRSAFEGQGMMFLTDGGYRELVDGDELIFLENSKGKRGIGVLNGDRGVVTSVARDRVEVELHGGRKVAFSPRAYKAWDHGNAVSVHKSQGASISSCVSVIDRSASAELVFVAMSRSKQQLSLVIAESNFRDLDELADHISRRISLKTTTRTYEELIERTGGPDTARIVHLEREEQTKDSPLRRRWEAECKEPALAMRSERLRELRESYDAKKREIAEDKTLSLSDRLKNEKAALRELREAVAAVHKETHPMRYTDWKKELDRAHELAHEIERERLESLRVTSRSQRETEVCVANEFIR